MPFFEATSNSEVSGGNFWDVEGDLNEYQHEDYSIQTSGQGNVVTQMNRPAMINNSEGGQVTINIHVNCRQEHLDFQIDGFPSLLAHRPDNPGYPMFSCPPSDRSMAHPQQLTSQPINYQPDVSSPHQSLAGSCYKPAPSSSPVMMPTPSLPFDIPPSPPIEKTLQKSSPVQMPVPTQAPAPQGNGMPFAPQAANPVTPPHESLSQEGIFDEPQPGFYPPAFRLSVRDARPEAHWSASSDQLHSPWYCESTSSPRAVNPCLVPLPTAPRQDGGLCIPVECRNVKHVPNASLPFRSLSVDHLSMSQRDNFHTTLNRNIGQPPMSPERQWTIHSASPLEKDFRRTREARPASVTGSGLDGIHLEGKKKKSKVRSMTEIIMGKQWS